MPNLNISQICKELLKKALEDGIGRFGVGAVIIHQRSVLLLRRKKSDRLPGMYEVPGGGVIEGEKLDQALKREVLEETGLRVVSIDKYLSSFDFGSKETGLVRYFSFAASVEIGQIKLTEHDDYKWVTSEQLDSYPMTDERRHILKEIFSTKS